MHLIEIEDRRLDLRAACTSMFDFCQRRLGMSEGASFRRITAARLVRRFPVLLERLERGELHLSNLVLLRPHLTEANVEELAAAVAGKTQRQVEELLARLEKERLGKVTTPRVRTRTEPRADARAIPAGVRREVFERDGEQCTFLDEAGERCPQRGHLELEHVEARALGGTNAASNLRVRCRAHNRLAAEEVFGKALVAERIDFRQRKSRADTAAPPSLSPPSPSPAPAPQVIEIALRGLHNLGFGRSDARRAVDHVSQCRVANGEEIDVKNLLREAIAALT